MAAPTEQGDGAEAGSRLPVAGAWTAAPSSADGRRRV